MTIRNGKLLLTGTIYTENGSQVLSGTWSKPAGTAKAVLLTQDSGTQFISPPGSGQTLLRDDYSILRYVVPASPTPEPQDIVFDDKVGPSPDYIGYASGHYYVGTNTGDGYQIYALDKNFSNAQPVGPRGVFGNVKNAFTMGSSLIFVDTNYGKIYSITGTTETEIGEGDLLADSSTTCELRSSLRR